MDEKVEYSDELGDDYPVLRCPTCEGSYLHQVGSNLVVRDEEDGPGTRVEVRKGSVNVVRLDKSEAYKAAGRRDSYELLFYCEECHNENVDHHHVMTIRQHKGQTHMTWGSR